VSADSISQNHCAELLETIHQSFAEAKVPQASMIEALEQLYEEQDDPSF
jgi:hypothetical protein